MSLDIGALPDLSLDAVIENIAPKGTDTNGANTFEIKAAISVPDGTMMRAGYSANATVTLNSARGVMTVPESVVEWAGDSTFVYVLTDSVKTQTFDRTPVTTGISDGINIQLTSGVDTTALLRGNPKKK